MLESIKKLLDLLSKKAKKKLIYLYLLMVISALVEVIGIALIPAYITIIQSPASALKYPVLSKINDILGFTNTNELVLWATVGLISLFLFKNIYLVWFYFYRETFIFQQKIDIGRKLFQAYLFSPYENLLHKNSAELLRNLRDNVDLVADNFMIPLLKVILESLSVILIFAFLIWAQPIASTIAALTLGTLGLGFLIILKKWNRKYGQREQRARMNVVKSINEGIGGRKESILMGRQDYFIDAYLNNATEYIDAVRFKRVTAQISRPFMETIAIGGLLVVSLSYLINHESLGSIVPTLAMFAAAAVRLIPGLNTIMSSINLLRYFKYSVDAVHTDYNKFKLNDNYNKDISTPEKELKFNQSIDLKDISFGYSETNTLALKDISISIPKGASVAFVGPSGAGKTTIADIILGLLKPGTGEILIDGQNVQNNLRSWQKKIGYIPQMIYLADDNISNNIAFGVPENEINKEKLDKAIEAAQLKDFIQELPEGLNTFIGEGGVRISGGQRQRIGIARALYNEPEVLVMDEATAALDNQTEREFVDALNKLQGKHTLIIIAHRLSTVKNVDKLYYLENGMIMSSGTYKELLEDSVEFQRMQ